MPRPIGGIPGIIPAKLANETKKSTIFPQQFANLVAVHPSFAVSFVAERLIVVLCRLEPYVAGSVRQHHEPVLGVLPAHSTDSLAFLYRQRDRFPVLELLLGSELLANLPLVVAV